MIKLLGVADMSLKICIVVYTSLYLLFVFCFAFPCDLECVAMFIDLQTKT